MESRIFNTNLLKFVAFALVVASATLVYGDFKSPCGNQAQVSARIGRCLDEIFELVEGKIGEPKSDADLMELCNRFNRTEKCVRAISKDCLNGVHRTTVGAISSATKRFRTQECKTAASRQRYREPLKCSLRKAKEMTALYKNYTAMAQAIRDLPIPPEQRLVKSCCLLTSLDKDIESQFNLDCPESTPLVLGIVHAMTDDARNVLCRNPRCQGVMDPLRRSKYKEQQNIIEPIMQIVFMISND